MRYALVVSLCGCGDATSPERTGEFAPASHTRVEGDVRGVNGVPLPGIRLFFSMASGTGLMDLRSELSESDDRGRFSGTAQRMIGVKPPPGTVEDVTVYLVGIANPPRYPLAAGGAPVRDSMRVVLRMVAPGARPMIARVTIDLPLEQ